MTTYRFRTRIAILCLGLGSSAGLANAQEAPIQAAPAQTGGQRVEWAIAPPGTKVMPLDAAPVAAPATSGMPLAPAITAPAAADQASVPYLTGGVGASGREEMLAAKSQYNLRLLFAEQGSGSYLSRVRVNIRSASGEAGPLLDVTSIGPWVYVALPAGSYRILVQHADQAQERSVQIPAQGAVEQAFYWPAGA